MKKLLALFLALVMVLSLCGCGGQTTSVEQTKTDLPEANKPEETIAPEVTEEPVIEVIKGKVTRTDGVVEEWGALDLTDLYYDNGAKYEKYYEGAEVEVVSYVDSIKMGSFVYQGMPATSVDIYFDDNWYVEAYYLDAMEEMRDEGLFCGVDIVELDKGDKMFIKGTIARAGSGVTIHSLKEFYLVD